ncbi:MAG: enoyl-CoA hydratase/isomerase family protein [Proteobacteria bacterium]|nr:enoyl-CoA hydratase/isomerase family protein [Pseudomonadota bacterium]
MAENLMCEMRKGGIALLTLNRPQAKNALSIALRNEVTSRLAELADDEALRVVVVTGAGDTFSAGFDLKEFQRAGEPAFSDQLWASSDRFHRAVLEFPLPIVAAVNGPALAGGFDLAAMCDLRIASTNATFSHPEVAFGEVAYGLLHDLLGGALARELCLLGRPVDAAEALLLNLVSAVAEPEVLLDEALALAGRLAAFPARTLRSTRTKIRTRSQNLIRGTLDL